MSRHQIVGSEADRSMPPGFNAIRVYRGKASRGPVYMALQVAALAVFVLAVIGLAKAFGGGL